MINLDKCKFYIDHKDQYCCTYFEDGTVVHARPKGEADLAFSREVGYGDDVWKLNWHHEFLHTIISQLMGLAFSPTLHSVAHGYNDNVSMLFYMEEGLVIHFQKLLNGVKSSQNDNALYHCLIAKYSELEVLSIIKRKLEELS